MQSILCVFAVFVHANFGWRAYTSNAYVKTDGAPDSLLQRVPSRTQAATMLLALHPSHSSRAKRSSVSANPARLDGPKRFGSQTPFMQVGVNSTEQQASPPKAPKKRTPGPRTAKLPPPEDLSDEVMLSIVLQEMSDEDVNKLIWKYLGYRLDDETGKWDASGVFPKWAAKFPEPPDLVGITRNYSRDVDAPVLRAVQALQKSVPLEHKDNLRAFLAPLGWSGFKMQGLTPNMTRRAQVAQWLYYYREALHGVSLDELRQRRDQRIATEKKREEAGEILPPTGTTKQGVL